MSPEFKDPRTLFVGDEANPDSPILMIRPVIYPHYNTLLPFERSADAEADNTAQSNMPGDVILDNPLMIHPHTPCPPIAVAVPMSPLPVIALPSTGKPVEARKGFGGFLIGSPQNLHLLFPPLLVLLPLYNKYTPSASV
jgi:hypothetical protein